MGVENEAARCQAVPFYADRQVPEALFKMDAERRVSILAQHQAWSGFTMRFGCDQRNSGMIEKTVENGAGVAAGRRLERGLEIGGGRASEFVSRKVALDSAL